MSVFDSTNMIITWSNIIFFIIVQTLFFKLIASQQFVVLLQNKVGIVDTFQKYNSNANKRLNKFINSSEAQTMEEKAQLQEKERNKKNWSLIKKTIGPILLIAVGVLLFSIYREMQNPTWRPVDWAILSLVVFAYATEILFFFGVVRKYQFYGDQQIFNKFYTEINQKLA